MTFPLKRFTVSGNSMLPTLKPNQDVLVLCWFFEAKKGDLVVFKKNGKEMIKRISAIKEDKFFVLGDNPKESTDSRSFGAISRNEIIGKVTYISGQNDMVDCPSCSFPVIGIYGRKDAICKNCGFKLTCCGEP